MNEPTTTPTATTTRRRIRTIFSAIFGIVAVIGLFASTLASWGRSEFFNSDTIADAARKALAEPGATEAVSAYLTTQIFEVVEAEQRLNEALPENLTILTPILVGGAKNFVESRVTNVLNEPRVQEVLVGVVREAHKAFVRVLEGDDGISGVSIKGDEVQLNLLPLVTVGLDAVQGLGLLQRVDLPEFTVDGDPNEQIAELESALGVDLPDDFAQLTVFKGDAVLEASSTVQQAQNTVVLVKRSTAFIFAATVLAWILALALAHRRRRTALTLVFSGIAVMLVARFAINRVVSESPNLVVNPGARAALASALRTLAGGLFTTITWLVAAGAVAALVVIATGSGDRMTAIRTRISAWFTSLTNKKS
jgi:hypothetical protein